MIKNRAAILAPPVAELPVRRGRIDIVPENLQQFLVVDFGGVVCDAHRLGVPGAAGGNLFIGRILLVAPGVP